MSIHSAANRRLAQSRHPVLPEARLKPSERIHKVYRQTTVAKRDPHPSELTPINANRSADKYQRILDAAVAVFAEKGFFVSRVSDIADRAGVADGTVYLYFKNKDEILASAINTAFDGFMKTARTELDGLRSDLPEKIAANCFFGAIDEMVTSWVLSEKDYPLSNVADPLLDILLSGMRATSK